jgi:hypothetical protein
LLQPKDLTAETFKTPLGYDTVAKAQSAYVVPIILPLFGKI